MMAIRGFHFIALLALAATGCSSETAPSPQPAERDQAVARDEVDDPASIQSYSSDRFGPIAIGVGNLEGISPEQLEAMFAAALDQAKPEPKHNAACVGFQGINDRWLKIPPREVVVMTGNMTRLPALAASECAIGDYPYVLKTKSRAILYAVKIENIDGAGRITFWAHALYAKLGANGAKFRLNRAADQWVAEPAGQAVIS